MSSKRLTRFLRHVRDHGFQCDLVTWPYCSPYSDCQIAGVIGQFSLRVDFGEKGVIRPIMVRIIRPPKVGFPVSISFEILGNEDTALLHGTLGLRTGRFQL